MAPNITQEIEQRKDLYIRGEKLGLCSQGIVYKGIKKDSNTPIAIKEIVNGAITAEKAKVIEDEIKLLMTLEHKGIPKIIDYYVDKRDIFIITDYADGVSLEIWLSENSHNSIPNVLSTDEVNSFNSQIIETLQYLDKVGVIHRDINPDNIIYDAKTNQFRLIGFGCNINTYTNNNTLEIKGKREYMAPELLQLDAYGPEDIIITSKVDIWSYGATLLKITTDFTIEHRRNLIQGNWSFHNNVLNKFNIPQKEKWNLLSEDIQNSIKKSLEIDYFKRANAYDLNNSHDIIKNLKEKISILTNINNDLINENKELKNNICEFKVLKNENNDIINHINVFSKLISNKTIEILRCEDSDINSYDNDNNENDNNNDNSNELKNQFLKVKTENETLKAFINEVNSELKKLRSSFKKNSDLKYQFSKELGFSVDKAREFAAKARTVVNPTKLNYFKGYYEGEVDGDNKMHGYGIIKCHNGFVYEGSFENNKQQGFGILRFPDGEMYEGSWECGYRHGYGAYKHHNGDLYEGEWHKDNLIKYMITYL